MRTDNQSFSEQTKSTVNEWFEVQEAVVNYMLTERRLNSYEASIVLATQIKKIPVIYPRI